MTQLTATDLENAKLDVDTIAGIANSTANTVTDRLGASRRTIYSLQNEYPNASANAAAAAASAAVASAAKTVAEAARDVAQLMAGVYADTTAGLAATTNGQYFSVPASADDVLILYKNNAGAAVEQFRYPSAVSVSKRLELVDGTLDNGAEVALVIHDSADKVVAWVDTDAIWHFPTMPGISAVGSAFTDLENDPDWLMVFVDSQDRIAWGIRTGGLVYPEAAPAKDGLSYSEVFHFVLHGQSLAEGDESLPIVSNSSSGFGNYRFSRGVRTWSSTDNPTTPTLRASSGFSFNDLIADENGAFGETIANGVADGYKASFGGRYAVNAQASLNPHVLVSYAGRGSTRLTQLNSEDTGRTDSRDTHAAPGGYWLTMLDDIARAKNSAASDGKSYAVAGLIYMQGERDSDLRIYEWEDPRTPSNHFATWRDKFKAMADEFDSSARAITGQLRKIPTFLYQTSNNITGNAQLAAEEEHVDIYMIGPTYAVPSALNGSYFSGATQVWGNSVHLSADGQRWFGEQAAKVMRRTLVEKEDWRPLRPLRAKKINSTTVDVEFHVPRPPLVVDTNFLAKCVNFGFAAYGGTIDARGTRCDVSNVEVVGGGTTLRLTFSTNLPAGAFLSSGMFSTCDFGASYAVASVGTSTPSSTGFSRYSLTITGDIRSQLKPLTDEGAFNLYSTNSAGVIREVQLVSGNTVLIGEDRELRTGGSYRPFLAGDVLTFGRPFAYTNVRDSDNEGSLNTFASTAYGTRAGKRYPLWNWCALFDNFAIIGA